MNKERKGIVKKILLHTFFVVFLLLATGCGNSNEKKGNAIKIGYLPITHALPIFELADEGDKEFEIELVKFSGWSDLTDALNTGRIDGAVMLIELAMKSKEQGIDISAVALGHKDGNVIVVGNGIFSANDLKGKTFAIPHRSSSHNILFHDMIEKNGLSEKDITVTELAPSEMPSALANGQIAGYCVAEPFGSVAVTGGYGKVLYTSKDLWEDSLCCSLVFKNSFLDKNSKLAENLVEKYYLAGEKLNNKTEAKKIAQKYLGQEETVLEQSLEWIDYSNLKITKEAYSVLCKKVKAYGVSDNPPDYKEFIYSDNED